METKNVLKRMALFVWVVALLVGFTACSSEDDEPYVVTYDVAVNLTVSGEDDPFITIKVLSDYSTVLDQVMGGSFCTKDKDVEIIEACDKVFEKHKTQYTNAFGYAEIRKTVGTMSSPDDELPSTVLKTYNYE